LLNGSGINIPVESNMNYVNFASRIDRKKSSVTLINKGFSLCEAASITGYSISTVTRSLKRLNNTGDIEDRPRNCNVTYSESFKLELIAFYCQTQPFQNSGRWTLRCAEVYLAAHPKKVNGTPSKSTIHRILQEHSLKPHQSLYFLHITDPNFFPKMHHLIKLYLNPLKKFIFL
jgi:transposase